MPVAIEIDSLNKVYASRRGEAVSAVNNLTLSIPQGQVFGLLGANGAGKTTTIKMICGLIIPTSGAIRIYGHDIARERRAAVQRMGAVLEGARNVYWRLSAWENVLYFGQLKGCGTRMLKTRAEQLLRELDLWERKDQVVRLFSRGMQQKVAIACALIADPQVILMDEPTLGLDIEAAQTVKAWILKLVKEHGKTIVLTTHQLDLAQELCDHIAIMRKGSLVTTRPIVELLDVFRQEHYQIKMSGPLEQSELAGFDGLQISQETDGSGWLLSGVIQDQQTLDSLLRKILDLNLSVLSVSRREPNLEEVFLYFMRSVGKGETYASNATANRR